MHDRVYNMYLHSARRWLDEDCNQSVAREGRLDIRKSYRLVSKLICRPNLETAVVSIYALCKAQRQADKLTALVTIVVTRFCEWHVEMR